MHTIQGISIDGIKAYPPISKHGSSAAYRVWPSASIKTLCTALCSIFSDLCQGLRGWQVLRPQHQILLLPATLSPTDVLEALAGACVAGEVRGMADQVEYHDSLFCA